MEEQKGDDDGGSDSWIGPWDVVAIVAVLVAAVKIVQALNQCN